MWVWVGVCTVVVVYARALEHVQLEVGLAEFGQIAGLVAFVLLTHAKCTILM